MICCSRPTVFPDCSRPSGLKSSLNHVHLKIFHASGRKDKLSNRQLNTAQELFREAAREAAEAGLKPAEILELAHKVIKGK
jgi:DNA-binding transcriptional regulator YhcF (GntR family)